MEDFPRKVFHGILWSINLGPLICRSPTFVSSVLNIIIGPSTHSVGANIVLLVGACRRPVRHRPTVTFPTAENCNFPSRWELEAQLALHTKMVYPQMVTISVLTGLDVEQRFVVRNAIIIPLNQHDRNILGIT